MCVYSPPAPRDELSERTEMSSESSQITEECCPTLEVTWLLNRGWLTMTMVTETAGPLCAVKNSLETLHRGTCLESQPLGELRKEEGELQATLDYAVRFCLNKQQIK